MNLNTRFFFAVEKRNFSRMNALLSEGADVHWHEDTAFRFAAGHTGDLKIVNHLLKAGADPHARNEEAFRLAARKGHFNIVKRLLEENADVHAKNNEALRNAAQEGHLKIVKFLLEHGATFDPEWERIPEDMLEFCLNYSLGPKSATKLS